ncbi:mad3/BUB1 homology region 1 [Wolffia australiana]
MATMSTAGGADLFSSVVSEIKAYQGKDPLCPWLRGIRRLREFLPRHVLNDKLPRFLQRCAETFESDRRYRSDLRFLRVWFQLMDHVDDPRAVFRRMEKNRIGVKHAAFYVAYSLYYEKQKDFDAAEKMFLLGAQRLAEPGDELQKSYEQFQCRLELHRRRKSKLNQLRMSERDRDTDGPAGPKGQIVDSQEESTIDLVKPGSLPNDDTVVVNFVGSAIVGKSEAEDACHHGLVDPTVNMKEALNTISSMFREPLDVGPRPNKKANPIPPRSMPPEEHGFEIFMDEENKAGFEIFVDQDADDDDDQSRLNGGDGVENRREDTVVFRFVGSTIAGDRAVENACHSGLVDPTVNLKEAMEDINSMFGKPIDFSREGRRTKEMTPHRQEFAILVDDIVDCQPSSTSRGGPDADSGLYEPTVFTKEAISEINDLFSRPMDF